MSDFGRFLGIGPSNGKGNRASVASSESDSASTVRVDNQTDTTSAREMMPPPPTLPIRIPPPKRPVTAMALSSSKDDSESGGALLSNKPPPPQRTRSGVGIFKVPSYLSLRSNSNSSVNGGKQTKAGGTGSGRGGGSADNSRAPTPKLGSQETVPPSWFEFSRRGNMRDASASAGSTGSTASNNQDEPLSSSSSGVPPHSGSALSVSSNAVSSTLSTSAVAASAAAARNKEWANMFVPSAADENSLFLPEGPSNFSWHRPSLLQVVEALQVALLSKETAVTGSPAGTTPYPATQLSSSPISLSRRRPSTNKTSHPIVPTGQGDAIPGRYRSYVAYLLEGVQMLQDNVDEAELRATKAEKAHKEALEQFSKLSDEWVAHEKRLTQELQQLRSEARKSGSMLAAESTSNILPTSTFAPAAGGISSRVKEAIRTSETILGKVDRDVVPDKLARPPALITDLNHDKAISDQYLKMMATAQRKQRPRGRRPAEVDPLLAAPKMQISVAQQEMVDDLRHKSKQTNSRDKDNGKKAPSTKKKTRKHRNRITVQAGDGHVSPSASDSQSYFADQPTSESSTAVSSSSSSEECPGTFVSDVTMLPVTVPVKDNPALLDKAKDVQVENADAESLQ